MEDELGSGAARRVAMLWRRVRWGAAAFCVVQFAAYRPTAGVRPPLPMLLVGLVLAAGILLVNVAATAAERALPRAADGGVPGASSALARRDLLLLLADLGLVVAVVELFAFDPAVAAWALLVVPVLEAGLVGLVPLALGVWGACVAALAAGQVLAVVCYGQRASIAGVVSAVGYRSGVLLLVALVVGTQASATASYVRLLHAARERLAHEASHDHLTGLAARGLFLDRATRALQAQCRRGGAVGLLFVDCDHFKQVNDVYGHAAGDAVLVEVARRLRAAVRPDDTVARLGGDEFAVLLERLDAGRLDGGRLDGGRSDDGRSDDGRSHVEDEAHRIADRIRGVLASPYLLPGRSRPVSMSCSVGVAVDTAVDTGHGDPLPALLRRADAAMYRSKTRIRPSAGLPATVVSSGPSRL